jgi:hypothetical protein
MMEYDHRVIIRFLFNEIADPHDITQILQGKFAEDASAF